jgi:hypothetical protein
MTAPELLNALEKHHHVVVGENRLAVPRRAIAEVIAEILRPVLPNEEVVFAIETSSLDDRLLGELVWLLVLSRTLVEVKTAVQVEVDVSDVKVVTRVLPLAKNVTATVDTRRQGPELAQSSTGAKVQVDGHAFEVRGKAAGPFVRAILSASDR